MSKEEYKPYFGVSAVTATPMLHGQAVSTERVQQHPLHDQDEEGYLVSSAVYGKHWIYKDQFEATYQKCFDHESFKLDEEKSYAPQQKHTIAEFADITRRGFELSQFMGTKKFLKVSEGERSLMAKQLDAMSFYRDILAQRISLF